MSGRRPSGKKRRKHEFYETPAWVVLEGLTPFFPVKGLEVLEPACGTGQMVRALLEAGAADVTASDILKRKRLALPQGTGFMRADFLKLPITESGIDALITNPPFGQQGVTAEQFIEKGLAYLRWAALNKRAPAFMALLLSVDFDLAVGRVHLFERCPEFHGVIRLRRRIEWFKRKKKRNGQKGSGPSQNHAWFIWKSEARPNGVPPVTFYAPSTGALL